MERPLPECWMDFADALDAGIDRVILYGPPGTGKTYAALREQVGPTGAHRLVCTEDMTSADVTGCWMPTASGQFEWLDGAAVRAWRGDGTHGARLVVDEADRAAGDVLALLLAVCDTDGSARFDHPALGEVVTPNDGFSVVMTTNLEHPDELPHALRDRFPVMIQIDAPHPDAVGELPEDLRDAAIAITSARGERRTSLRAFYAYARLRESVEPDRAARLAFGPARGREIADALAIDAAEREASS
jgi:midasin (ATPase involved in ribosome maturation)